MIKRCFPTCLAGIPGIGMSTAWAIGLSLFLTASPMLYAHVQTGHDVSVELDAGVDGASLFLDASLSAELEAALTSGQIGDDQLGASAELRGKIEALVGARAQAGVWFNEEGIHIGADALAGAYVRASAEATFEARVFGVGASVTAFAAGTAGVTAHASACVTVGYGGEVSFSLSAGAAAKVGLAMGLRFSLDAASLITALDLSGYDELIEWVADFAEDPGERLGDLMDEAFAALIDEASAEVKERLEGMLEEMENSWKRIQEGVSSWLDDIVTIMPALPDFGGGLLPPPYPGKRDPEPVEPEIRILPPGRTPQYDRRKEQPGLDRFTH